MDQIKQFLDQTSDSCVISTFVVESKDKNKSVQGVNKPVPDKIANEAVPGKSVPGKLGVSKQLILRRLKF